MANQTKETNSMEYRKQMPRCALKLPWVVLGLSPAIIFAQSAPDAGKVLLQQSPTLEIPKASPSIKIAPPETPAAQPGGPEVSVRSVTVDGNTLFSTEELLGVIGDVSGKFFDLAGLKGLTNRVTDFYHQAGYPFARAYLPPQPIDNGQLLIQVLEGRYGQVQALGDEDLVAGAQDFLVPLKRSEVIESSSLERISLLLDDLPGVKAVPVMRPGETLGSGDLDVRLERRAGYTGDVGVDNQGNRYTGQMRAHLNVDVNSPFTFGDQFTLRSLLTEQGMWFGTLGYSLPLGGSGLRGILGYTHTYYELGKNFSSLQANGTADVTNVGLSYPIIRSQQTNLSLTGSWVHKTLVDKQDATGTDNHKESDTFPIGLNFDTRDGLGGGGITYGNVTWASGNLNLNTSSLAASDSTTAKTAGSFSKVNFDVARIQALPSDLSLYGRFSSQFASKNLDSSELFGLGGPSGVRAYPVGEGYGSEGWLAQLELRYATGAFAPYAFYDSGWVKINKSTWTVGENERSISGYGLGVRYTEGGWRADASIAWRDRGGKPLSDTRDSNPVGWVSVGYKF